MAEATIPILEMKNVGKTYSQNGRSIEANPRCCAWPPVLRPQRTATT